MSYTDNGTAVPKILEENHYYPFGLKHENYASERFEFIKEPHGTLYVIQPTERREWQYKYQGQERQDELNLNWDSFKWRNYDFAIGRFMCVDPLAEKYAKWSPYTFSGNIVVNAREIEGLEPGVLFGTMDAAADNWGQQYNARSINVNQEYGSTIYQTTSANGTVQYSYSAPNVGTTGASVSVSPAPAGTIATGDIHSHAAYDPAYANNVFSGIPATGANTTSTTGDIGDNNQTGLTGYVTTPNGSLQKYDPITGTITTISTNLPSDRNDPTRLNTISTTPPVVPLTPITPSPITPSNPSQPVAPIPIIPRNPAPETPRPPKTPLPLPKISPIKI